MRLSDYERSGVVFLAAAWAALAGAMALVGAVVVGWELSTDAVLVWVVLGTQVVAGVVLLLGALRLWRGDDWGLAAVGGVLGLVVSGVYLLYALAEEPGLVVLPVGFAVVYLVSVGFVLGRGVRRFVA